MSGWLEVQQPGIGTSVQDGGRHGYRHHGLPLAGWLDAPLAQAANALLGNPLPAAVLELRGAGTRLRVNAGPVRVALAGCVDAQCTRADGRRWPLPAWQTATLHEGDVLQLGPATSGCAYLAVSGGWDLAPALGSRSTDRRAGLAGVLGRTLQPGDLLPCGALAGADPREWRSRTAWTCGSGSAVRVIAGPQDDHFTAEGLATFFSHDWTATTAQDRMGLRLAGPVIAHRGPEAADILSDGVTPGAIQVPADGRPIVLLADGQTVGGYPKIATVISADLPRLAHVPPGARIRFQPVTPVQARQALQAERQRWEAWLNTREAFLPPGSMDDTALRAGNLISGMVRADP